MTGERREASRECRRTARARSSRGPSAIDGDRLAGDVAAQAAGQQQEHAVELVQPSGATDRRVSAHVLGALVAPQELTGEIALEPSWRDGIDPDAVAGPLAAELAGQSDDPRLRCGVGPGRGRWRRREALRCG